ncbi:MAG: class I SAM-dependent methyltransferase [Immundisolibacter sp.]|uniref:class I SAM-dependent methyltransferase n=1 Tax=Immundisolibacter sp. TaxID=1934948 RepID=UPI003EE41F12
MEASEYRFMAEHEDRHWWFVGRRAVLAALLDGLALPADARILEVGCGTGGNLPLLGRYGQVTALEMDAYARAFAQQKTGVDVRDGVLPQSLPFVDERFDLVCLFDVLEHVADDHAALAAITGLLAPGGRLLLTVPAHQWLWSVHDQHLHHRRRYSRAGLRALLEANGYVVDRTSFFNALLFLPAAAVRLVDRWRGRLTASGAALPSAAINRLLTCLFAAEAPWLRRWNLPFGLSLLALAKPIK